VTEGEAVSLGVPEAVGVGVRDTVGDGVGVASATIMAAREVFTVNNVEVNTPSSDVSAEILRPSKAIVSELIDASLHSVTPFCDLRTTGRIIYVGNRTL
jgi:hypothetical protein